MKILSEEANLESKGYTNHSIRATCISKLDSSGFEAQHITALTSHKSESTIKEYSVKCPDVKCREMFEALASPIKPKSNVNAVTSTISALTELATLPQQNFNIDVPQANNIDLSDMDLLELDNDDDRLLVDILTQTEKSLKNDKRPQVSVANVTSVHQNSFNPVVPVVPRMYFPHSNVTINYNFSK